MPSKSHTHTPDIVEQIGRMHTMVARHVERLDALEDRMEALHEDVHCYHDEVVDILEGSQIRHVPVDALADALDVETRTVLRRAKRHDIPVRNMHGKPKTDRSKPYILLDEWMACEKMDPQVVRRLMKRVR